MLSFNAGMLKAYFICGTQDLKPEQDLVVVVQTALRAGITAYQFRDKGKGSTLTPETRVAVAKRLKDLCQLANVPFIVDDDVDLAKQVHADGIHVGQSDEGVEAVITELGDQAFIGLSCSNEAEITAANPIDGIAYYGSGPVFPTGSKADADPVIGLDGLQHLVALANRPVVGIGGITVDQLPAVIKTGAAGSSVISMIAGSDDIAGTVKAMLNA